MGTKAQKLTAGLFFRSRIFLFLHLKGTGHFVISAFGALMEIPIPAGQEYIVDNGHVVAWSGDTQYHMVKAGKTWWSSLTSGEGLACNFKDQEKFGFKPAIRERSARGWASLSEVAAAFH